MKGATAMRSQATGTETQTWRIETLCCGVLHGVPEAALMYMDASGSRVDLPILAWLLRRGSETILIDTGPTNPEWARERFHPELDLGGSHTLVEQLAACGLQLADIDVVVNTHLHWDHCGGNALLPDSTGIYVQREEVRFASAPIPTQLAPYEAFELGVVPPWVGKAGSFRLIEGELQIRPGIRVIPLAGHTPGSQGVLVDTAGGRYCITGDLLDSLENVERQMTGWPEHIRGVPPGIHTDVVAWYRSLRMLQGMGVELIPAHDWEVLKTGSFG